MGQKAIFNRNFEKIEHVLFIQGETRKTKIDFKVAF